MNLKREFSKDDSSIERVQLTALWIRNSGGEFHMCLFRLAFEL